MSILFSILSEIPDLTWKNIIKDAKKKNLSNYGWYNNKYYQKSKNNDGRIDQIDRNGHKGIPFDRKLFYARPSARFSLGSKPVAYFSNDFGINCCETIDLFRNNEALTWDKELDSYFNGEMNPTPELVGYPIHVRISPISLILDLSRRNNSVIKFIEGIQGFENIFSEVILSRNVSVYDETQMIAKEAFNRGFDGISYSSVRGPKDVVLTGKNLVVFNEKIIIEE